MMYPIMHSTEEKISPKCVLRELIELSTMSNGSTTLDGEVRGQTPTQVQIAPEPLQVVVPMMARTH